ncbi:MAG TPA: hypothetical protein VF192_05735 [Longimicrobiales bacterium]
MRRRAERRRWANVAAIVAGVYALGFAVWSPGLAGGARLEADLRAQGWWWAGSAVGGLLALAAAVAAVRSRLLGRVLLVLAALVLLATLLAFRRIGTAALLALVLPALVMLAAAPFLGAMPAPEEEGKRR